MPYGAPLTPRLAWRATASQRPVLCLGPGGRAGGETGDTGETRAAT